MKLDPELLSEEVRANVLVHSTTHPFERKTDEASGFDLYAIIGTDATDADYVDLQPLQRWRFSTGVYVACPKGVEAQVRPRSGMVWEKGLVAMFGTCDSDYRGEILITAVNLSADVIRVKNGDRIAQLVFAPVALPMTFQVQRTDMPITVRGDRGFGSTGSR